MNTIVYDSRSVSMRSVVVEAESKYLEQIIK